MNRFLQFLTLMLFVAETLTAQTKTDLKQIFDDAQYFFLREDYSEALYYYIQLHQYDPNNASLNYKIGTCFLNIKNGGKKAIPFLEKAVKNTTVNYNSRSFNERKAPFHSYFYLGKAYRINNEIDKALEIYNEFINSPDFYGNYNVRLVTDEIKACERAKIIVDDPIKIDIQNVGNTINTESSNYQAVVSGNNEVMVFITTLKFYEGIFESRKKNGAWTQPVNINPQVLSDGDMFPTCLSYNGNELFLVKKGGTQNDLYYSKYVNGSWTSAEKLNENINTRFNEDHACISKDGKTLFFTSDRKGGVGDFDIYLSEMKTNGDWGEAVNLGETVNSPFNERNPFITEDNKRLYFSSDGHFNMGGYDVFYSESLGGEWETPKNIGFPINTTGDDLFFVPVYNGKMGYMSLFREDSFGDEDIYLITILEGDDLPKDAQIPDDFDKGQKDYVNLKLINTLSDDTLSIIYNKKTERFDLNIPENFNVIVEEK